jgi:predicted metalloprotease with PDZ domain
MKKNILFTFLIMLITSCSKNNEVSYKISQINNKEGSHLKIAMEFKVDKSGKTILLFQDKAWGQENLHNTISDFVSEKATEIEIEKDSGWIVLKHPKSLNTINFSYILKQDSKLPITTKSTYRPVIQKEYFHIFSHNLFMIPKNYVPHSFSPFNVNLEWVGFDNNFNLVNSFGTNEPVQKIKNTNEDQFHSAIFTGGNYKPYILNINGNKAVLAIKGEWEIFKDSTMVTILEKTLQVQRDFWKDHSQKYFAVTMTPTHLERGSSFQGSGLTNSFATSASNNEYLELEGLLYLFNHELQHNWIGLLIKNDNEEEQYWFSEGFTDYYTIKNIAKNNINNLDESYFIKEFNQIVKALYISPVKEAPNKEINYTNFWTNHDYSKLPYRRGAVFAFYLDNKIKQDSNGEKSLDDLMLAIKDDAMLHAQKITHTYFVNKANQFLKEDLKPFFEKHIENGKLFDMVNIFNQFRFDYNHTSKAFDLGFTFTKDKKHIVEIDEKSNAYKAGLRMGDRITSRSYYRNNPNKEAFFKVKGKSYKYFPVKESDIPTLKENQHNKTVLSF